MVLRYHSSVDDDVCRGVIVERGGKDEFQVVIVKKKSKDYWSGLQETQGKSDLEGRFRSSSKEIYYGISIS